MRKNHTLPNKLFPFIWHFLRTTKLVVFAQIALPMLAGLWGPFNSILIKNVIDLLPKVQNGDVSILTLPVCLIVVNFIIFDNFTWRSHTYLKAKHAPVILNRIIADVMDYVLKHSHQFFQDRLSGKISKQITNLVDGVDAIVTNIAKEFLRGGTVILAALVAAYFVNPIFALIMGVWAVFFASVSVYMSRKLVSYGDKQAATESRVVGEMVDSITNQSNVQIFAKQGYECVRLLPFLKKQQTAYFNTHFYAFVMHSVQGALIAAMMGFTAYFLVNLYKHNLVTVGDFALIFGLTMETGHIVWHTMFYVDEFNKAVGRCKQSLSSLITPLEIHDMPDAFTLRCTQGRINFKNVDFHYQGTEALFCNKSIDIEPGQKVGLVGYSGGGKTTFVNLILRLYEVSGGDIRIDGQNIRDVTQESLYESIAMIPQDPSLFNRSLMENIRYSRIEASDEEVISAAKKAHAHAFITQLPEGYNSLVGERGVKLSGGQRQRIAIARAVLKNAPILILDEATSQLDSITENLIQDTLITLMQKKTTIVIAHRLSTLMHMDRILVFDNGKIVEDGTHKSLLAKGEVYKKLWSAQVGGFLSDQASKD